MGLCPSIPSNDTVSPPVQRSFIREDIYTANADSNNITPVEYIHSEPINDITYCDECHLITACNDRALYVYDWTSHKVDSVLAMPHKAPNKVVYNSSSRMVYAGSRCGQICMWVWPNDSRVTTSMPRPPNNILNQHQLRVTGLACNKDYSHILVSGSRDNSVKVWDINKGSLIKSSIISRNLVTDIQWVPNECSIVQSSEDMSLRLWDIRTCTVTNKTPINNHIQLCCSVSDCSQFIVSGSDGQEGHSVELTVWDRRNMTAPFQLLHGHTSSVNGCTFIQRNHDNTDSMLVSCSSDGNIILWDYKTGNEVTIQHLQGSGPLSALTSPAHQLVACSSFKGGVTVWGCGQDSFTLRAKY